MSEPKLLPESYESGWGRQYSFQIGGWAWAADWNPNDPVWPFDATCLWQIQEPEPGKFVAHGYGIEQVVELTPDNCRFLLPLTIKVSQRLRLEQYPDYWKRFRDKGITAFFHESTRGQVVFAMWPPRGKRIEVALWPFWVTELQQDSAKMIRLLDQMFWCISHPRKANALFWAVTQHATPFGVWPQQTSPKELDKLGSEWLVLYNEELKRPVSQEQLIRSFSHAMASINAQRQESEESARIQDGGYDERLMPGIYNLLDGTGIEPPTNQ